MSTIQDRIRDSVKHELDCLRRKYFTEEQIVEHLVKLEVGIY